MLRYLLSLIDHGKYLRLLDDQAVAGFPSVMRVRTHFLERLPVVIAALKDYGPVPGERELSDQLSIAREFMVRKASCELAFLCAMAFFERRAAPISGSHTGSALRQLGQRP